MEKYWKTRALGNFGRCREAVATLPAPNRHPILADIDDVLRQLQASKSRFDLTEDEDLLEAFIFEQSALMARYTYLIKTARREGVSMCSKGPEEDTQPAYVQGRALECSTPSV